MDPGLAIRPPGEPQLGGALRAALPDWLPVVLGMAVLYVPTFHALFTGLWTTEEQAHGPIILLLSLWLMYRQWPHMQVRADGQPQALGWPVLGFGLLAYILGRSQGIIAFEIARRHRFASAMAALPEGVAVHLLPSGNPMGQLNWRQLRWSDLGESDRLIDNARRATHGYLAEHGLT